MILFVKLVIGLLGIGLFVIFNVFKEWRLRRVLGREVMELVDRLRKDMLVMFENVWWLM